MMNRNPEPVSLSRLRAAAAVCGINVAQLAVRCGVSHTHLRAVAIGERKPSARLVEAIKRAIGQSGWAFWRGQEDVLPMPVRGGSSPSSRGREPARE